MDKQRLVFLGAFYLGFCSAGVAQEIDDSASLKAKSVLKNNKLLKQSASASSATFSILTQIQTFRRAGHLKAAEEMALQYLKNNPNDGDVRYVLGSIQLEQKKTTQALANFQQALHQYPNYLDVRLSLIRLQISKKNFIEASSLIKTGLKLHPNEERLIALQHALATEQSPSFLQKKKPVLTTEQKNLNKVYQLAKMHRYQEQWRLLINLVARNEENISYRMALINYYIEHKNPLLALDVANKGLQLHPHNTDLLLHKGYAHNQLYQYPQAAYSFHEVLQQTPKNKPALSALAEISTINPFYNNGVNEVGIITDNAYVQDIHSIWDYSSIYYTRDINKGRIGGRVNFASRIGLNAAQYELDYSPRLSQNAYFDFSTAYSSQAALFPNWMGRGEGFLKVASNTEVSAGYQYSQITSSYFNTYTSSITFYQGNNLITFRPYFFIPKSNNNSILYTANVRHYFDVGDHYISIAGGSGTSPDIADLLTVNFIVIQNSFVNVNYEFPILNHLFVIDIGAGYQRWVYPSQLVRNIYDGKAGIKYRF